MTLVGGVRGAVRHARCCAAQHNAHPPNAGEVVKIRDVSAALAMTEGQ